MSRAWDYQVIVWTSWNIRLHWYVCWPVPSTWLVINRITFGELVCGRSANDIVEKPVWMDRHGMMEPFSKTYFAIDFVEHIAGHKVLPFRIEDIKYHEEDKTEQTWQHYQEFEQMIECRTGDRLRVGWRQGRWFCNLILDRRNNRGHWTILHAEFKTGRDADQSNPGVGIKCDDKLWLWLFVRRSGDYKNT